MSKDGTTHNYAPSRLPTRQFDDAPAPSGLSPVSSSWSHAAISLPDVLQSYAQNRRSGTLVVYRARQPHFLGLRQGNIVYLTGTPPGSLLHSLVWTGHTSIEEALAWQKILPEDDAEAARYLLDEDMVSVDALRDGLACLIEETFHEAFMEQDPEWDLAPEEPSEDWARVQENIGLSIGIAGLLMELMRTRDEFAGLRGKSSDTFDIPFPTANAGELSGMFDDAMRQIMGLANGQRCIGEIIRDSWIFPSQARMALALLLDGGSLRCADSDELIERADAHRDAGSPLLAIGMYRRALALGCKQPRVQHELGLLLAEQGSQREAAGALYQAGLAYEANTPTLAIEIFSQAVGLGADPRECWKRIATLGQQLGKRERAAEAIWALVEYLAAEGEHREALHTCSELSDLEADQTRLLRRQGELAETIGDYQKALIFWDELDPLLAQTDQNDERAWLQSHILALDPGRCDTALSYARYLQAGGKSKAAADVIRAALAAAGQELDIDVAIACHELLAEVDSSDAENRQWLADSYRRRADRQGALAQLLLLAQTHAQQNNASELVQTLHEILDIDPLHEQATAQLISLHEEQGQQEAAIAVWRQHIEAALSKGDASLALGKGEEALRNYPLAIPLRLLLVKAANRLGQKSQAIDHCLAAATLAELAGKTTLARQCLLQVLPVVDDAMPIYTRLIHLLPDQLSLEDASLLESACDTAFNSGNMGFAAAWARRWLEGDGIAPRSRLMQASMRLGAHLEAQALCEHLVDDLLAKGAYDQAMDLLSPLLERYPRSPNLLTLCARLQSAMGSQRQAAHTIGELIQILQQEGRIHEALALLPQLARLRGESETVRILRSELQQQQAALQAGSQPRSG